VSWISGLPAESQTITRWSVGVSLLGVDQPRPDRGLIPRIRPEVLQKEQQKGVRKLNPMIATV
jgi:hypothetical protein